MTEELIELLGNLQQVYGISDEDIQAVAQAIDITIQEAVGGGAGAGMPEGGEAMPPEAMMAEEEG